MHEGAQKVKQSKGRVAERLREEHQRLVEGLVVQGTCLVDAPRPLRRRGMPQGSFRAKTSTLWPIQSPPPASPRSERERETSLFAEGGAQEAVPGNIRRAEHFVAYLNRFLNYLWTRLDVDEVEAEGPDSFIRRIPPDSGIDKKSLRQAIPSPVRNGSTRDASPGSVTTDCTL